MPGGNRAAAREVLGELTEGMTAAEVIRDLQRDRALLQRELREAKERLRERVGRTPRAWRLRAPPPRWS
jgi:hypothetical protein